MDGRASILGHVRTLFDGGAPGLLSDEELLERFLAREGESAEAAFAALVERHGPGVLGICRRVLNDPHAAQDAFQATFLVLARKAGHIGKPGLLASWLHGVAYRTALKSRTAAARRHRHERSWAASAVEAGPPDEERRELRAVLDEEIARLPEKYRRPVVLCHLEGLSRQEAARRLLCPESTVNVRLLRARGRLREGLTRRGFAPAVALLTLGLWGESASAAVPNDLVRATARGGLRFAIGETASESVSARVLALARGVLKTMNWTRWKLTAAALLLAGTIAGGVGILAHRQSAASEDAKVADRPPASSKKPEWKQTLPDGATVEVIGISTQPSGPKTWWGPDGKPLATPPFDSSGGSVGDQPDRKARIIAIRVSGPGKVQDVGVQWVIDGAAGMASGTPNWNNRPADPGIRQATVSLPGDAATASFRLGVATGDWETMLTSSGGGITITGSERGQVAFVRAREVTEGGCTLAAADSLKGPEVRIVAVDREGKEHGPSTNSTASGGGLRLHDLTFALPLDQVKEFRFQTRPFEWAEFRDVPLDPRREGEKP